MPQLVSIDLTECNTSVIPAFSFNQKKYLMRVKLPRKLTVIGDRAFSGCIRLNGEIRLPSTLQEIEYGAFINCPKLKKIYLKEESRKKWEKIWWKRILKLFWNINYDRLAFLKAGAC